jgi:thymidylate synthase (FAD)
VTPVDWSAGDRAIAQYFWASTDKDQTAWSCSENTVLRVLNFGMGAQPVVHGTPFGHGHLTVHVDRVPLYVVGQLIRHRVQHQSGAGLDWLPNVSQKSYRYVTAGGPRPEEVDLSELMAIPEPGELRYQEGRPGEYRYVPIEEDLAVTLAADIRRAAEDAWGTYLGLVARGVAPEQARMVLPQSTLTRLYITASYRNWLTWLVQRDDPHTQAETRQVAAQVDAIISQCIPLTYQLWLSHGRRPL